MTTDAKEEKGRYLSRRQMAGMIAFRVVFFGGIFVLLRWLASLTK